MTFHKSFPCFVMTIAGPPYITVYRHIFLYITLYRWSLRCNFLWLAFLRWCKQFYRYSINYLAALCAAYAYYPSANPVHVGEGKE